MNVALQSPNRIVHFLVISRNSAITSFSNLSSSFPSRMLCMRINMYAINKKKAWMRLNLIFTANLCFFCFPSNLSDVCSLPLKSFHVQLYCSFRKYQFAYWRLGQLQCTKYSKGAACVGMLWDQCAKKIHRYPHFLQPTRFNRRYSVMQNSQHSLTIAWNVLAFFFSHNNTSCSGFG